MVLGGVVPRIAVGALIVVLSGCTAEAPERPPGPTTTTQPTVGWPSHVASERPVGGRGCGWQSRVPQAQRPVGAGEVPPLVAAVWEGDIGHIRSILDDGADPNLTDWEGETPLIAAVEARCVEAVRLLLAAGASPSRQRDSGEPPLAWAVNGGDTAIVDLLLRAGADPSEPGRDTASALHAAIGTSNVVLLDRLVQSASDLDVGLDGRDPGDAPAQVIGSGSPLEFAADIGCVECIELLIDAGARPTWVAVWHASYWGHQDAIEFLLNVGAPIGDRGSVGRSRLVERARQEGHHELARLIEDWP